MVFGKRFIKHLFATQLQYKLKLSALGCGLPPSGIIIPSFVLVGYAIPVPKVLVRILPSPAHKRHLPSTSN